MKRRWAMPTEGEAHHLIDPRTGRPSESDIASGTVLGRSVVIAEVEAKALLLLGSTGARRRAERLDIPAILIDHSGRITLLGRAVDYVVT